MSNTSKGGSASVGPPTLLKENQLTAIFNEGTMTEKVLVQAYRQLADAYQKQAKKLKELQDGRRKA